MSTQPELSIRICLKSSFPWRSIEDSLWDNLVAGVCFISRLDMIVTVVVIELNCILFVSNFSTECESCVRECL